jgi:hypothetical protein
MFIKTKLQGIFNISFPIIGVLQFVYDLEQRFILMNKSDISNLL